MSDPINQPSLFPEEQPRPRPTDPATSRIAADEIAAKLPKLQAAMLRAFSKPRTANEAAAVCVAALGGTAESYRKRKHELCRKGLIRFVRVQTCQITGKNAEVFINTLKG